MWVLARPLSGFAETFSQYVVELRPGGGSSAPEVDPTAEAVLFVTSGTLALPSGRRRTSWRPGGTRTCRRARPGPCTTRPRRPGRSTGSARGTCGSTGSLPPEALVTNEREVRAGGDAGDRRRVVDDPVRRDRRPAPRHARQHRQLPARRHDPVPGDARDGARAVRAGGQGGLPPQHRLGRGGGRRLHVAARVLSAGLLRRRARSVPLPALQGRQPPREAATGRRDARRRGVPGGRALRRADLGDHRTSRGGDSVCHRADGRGAPGADHVLQDRRDQGSRGVRHRVGEGQGVAGGHDQRLHRGVSRCARHQGRLGSAGVLRQPARRPRRSRSSPTTPSGSKTGCRGIRNTARRASRASRPTPSTSSSKQATRAR